MAKIKLKTIQVLTPIPTRHNHTIQSTIRCIPEGDLTLEGNFVVFVQNCTGGRTLRVPLANISYLEFLLPEES